MVEIEFSEVLGGILKHRRKKRPQRDLALAAGTSLSTWSRIEAGQTSMTVEQLRLASRELGLQGWELLREAEEISQSTAGGSRGFEVVDRRPPKKAKPADMLVAGAVGFLVGTFFASRDK